MPRTPYADPEGEAAYQALANARKTLTDNMNTDNYTGGLVSSKAGSEAQSIDEQVRRQR